MKAHSNMNKAKEVIEELKAMEARYAAQVEKNPKELFSHISIERIHLWREFLCPKHMVTSDKPQSHQADDLNLIDEIFLTELTLKNQSLIHTDCIRTRAKESKLISSFLNTLEQYISFYCKSKEIVYKQGLNEIFAPFILLKYSIAISYDEIYRLSSAFIDKFLPNYFRERSLKSLHSSLSLLSLLVKYHLPSIYNVFENNMINTEMYGTGWIMTELGSKLKLDCLYHLWDHLIRINDPIFLHFVLVALLKTRSDCIETCDETHLPILLSKLSLNSLEEVDYVMQLSLELRAKTPYSFRILSNRLNIFNSDEKGGTDKAYDEYHPSDMLAMPMFPSEILFITYRKDIKCPDNHCVYNELAKDAMAKATICEHCDLDQYKTINYILLDLRLITNGPIEERASFLPKMIMVPQNDLKTEDFHDLFTERFQNDKGKYHFILLTNSTDYFAEYERQFYPQTGSTVNRFALMSEHIEKAPTKVDKELIKDLQQEIIFKLKEYDNMKRTIFSFVAANYPYVSYVYGGYGDIHNESLKNPLTPLLNHLPNCVFCLKKESLSQGNKTSGRKGMCNQKAEERSVNKTDTEKGKTALGRSLFERKKRISQKDITSMSSCTDFMLSHCLLIEHNAFKRGGQPITVILNPSEVLIYQNSDESLSNTSKDLVLIECIELSKIASLRMKTSSKRIVTMRYKDEDICSVTSFIIDFLNDTDSKRFINAVKHSILSH